MTRDELIKECVKYKHSNINIQQLLTAVEAYSSASNNGKPIVSGSLRAAEKLGFDSINVECHVCKNRYNIPLGSNDR